MQNSRPPGSEAKGTSNCTSTAQGQGLEEPQTREAAGAQRVTRGAEAEGDRLSREEIESFLSQEVTYSKEGMRYLYSTHC